jgi:hypothetical protein
MLVLPSHGRLGGGYGCCSTVHVHHAVAIPDQTLGCPEKIPQADAEADFLDYLREENGVLVTGGMTRGRG